MERKPLKYPKPALAYEATTKELALFLKDRDVAAEIGRHYRNSNASLANAVSERLECGRLLIEQKDSLAHGEWLPWLKDNADKLGFSSERTAQMLMKGAANTKPASHLTEEQLHTFSQKLWGHDKPRGRSVVPTKRKEKPYGETYISPEIDDEDKEEERTAPNMLPTRIRIAGLMNRSVEAKEMAEADDMEGIKVSSELREAVKGAARAWGSLLGDEIPESYEEAVNLAARNCRHLAHRTNELCEGPVKLDPGLANGYAESIKTAIADLQAIVETLTKG